jgi:hypothetical protein
MIYRRIEFSVTTALFEESLAFELLTLVEHVSPGAQQSCRASPKVRFRDTCEPRLTMLNGMWRGTCAVGGARRLCWDRDEREQPQHRTHSKSRRQQ